MQLSPAGIQVVQDGKGLELRSAEYYTRHESGLYTGSKPGKGRGLPHETQSINRVCTASYSWAQAHMNNLLSTA